MRSLTVEVVRDADIKDLRGIGAVATIPPSAPTLFSSLIIFILFFSQ